MGFIAVTVEGYENAAKQRPSGTNTAKTFEDPVGRGLLGISSLPPPENTRPTSYSTLLGPYEKFPAPPLVATGQLEASATLGNASEGKRIADGLRPFSTLGTVRTITAPPPYPRLGVYEGLASSHLPAPLFTCNELC
jgi:hypothetical protein